MGEWAGFGAGVGLNMWVKGTGRCVQEHWPEAAQHNATPATTPTPTSTPTPQPVPCALQAQATYLRALAAAPDHTPSLTALGALYQAQGLLGEAVAAYQRAHELRPADGAIREGLAVVLTDQGTKLKNAGGRGVAWRGGAWCGVVRLGVRVGVRAVGGGEVEGWGGGCVEVEVAVAEVASRREGGGEGKGKVLGAMGTAWGRHGDGTGRIP